MFGEGLLTGAAGPHVHKRRREFDADDEALLAAIFEGNVLFDPVARREAFVSSLLRDDLSKDITSYLTGRARIDKEVKFSDLPTEGKKLLFEAIAK